MNLVISRRAALIGGAGVVDGEAAMLFDTPNSASATPQNVGGAAG